jgi:hypothetical protein
MTGLISLPQDAISAMSGDTSLSTMCKSYSFLPRIQIAQGTSKAVTDGDARPGEILVISDKTDNKGSQLEFIPIVYRFKAMDMSVSPPVSFHHLPKEQITKPGFIDIQNRADNVQNSQCSYGPEALVFIPSDGIFATFLFGSTTMRNCFGDVFALMGKCASITSDRIEGKKNKKVWFGIKTTAFSGDVANLPNQADLEAEVAKFLNPIDSKLELAESANAGGEDRAV